MSRPRHPRKELEQLLKDLEDRQWRVDRGRAYFKAYCPCGDHKETIHLTPSDRNYERNKRKKIARTDCWKD